MTERTPAPSAVLRVWRLAFGVGLAALLSYALAPDMASIFVLLALFILLPPKAPPALGELVKLLFILVLATVWGMALGVLIGWIPALGIGLFLIGMVFTLRFGLARPDLGIISMLFTVGQTLIAAVSFRSVELGVAMMLMMIGGFVFAFAVAWLSHVFLMRDAEPQVMPVPPANRDPWVSVRAALIMLPPFFAALQDLFFIPLLIKGAFLAQQVNTDTARQQAVELVLATLIGSLATVLLWQVLSLWPNLIFLSLCLMLAIYLLACPLYGAWRSRFNFLFWQNVLVTMIILIGPAVQDPVFGDDVREKMWIRIGLFLCISLYSILAVKLLDGLRGIALARKPAGQT